MKEIKYEFSLYFSVRYLSPIHLRTLIIRLQGHLFHSPSSVCSTLINETNHFPAQVMLIKSSVNSVLLYTNSHSGPSFPASGLTLT
jgi:hypothetical protein